MNNEKNSKINSYAELARAKTAYLNIMKYGWQYESGYVEDVFPIIDVALQWDNLKNSGKVEIVFLEECRKRMAVDSSNFLGFLFEMDMATRCILSGWKCRFLEDRRNNRKQMIDLIVEKRDGTTMGLECSSKRGTTTLDMNDVSQTVLEKSTKFSEGNLSEIGTKLDKKIIILDVTQRGFRKPEELLKEFEKTEIPELVDGIILTWRESFPFETEQNRMMPIKYAQKGDLPNNYFTTTMCAHLSHQNGEPIFFFRSYVEPEPRPSSVGPEESRLQLSARFWGNERRLKRG